MSSGHIFVAEQDNVYIIKLVGDVRLTLCVSFDQFIAAMFEAEHLSSVLFDLRETVGIDSTTLGLIAKISIGARKRGLPDPVVVVNDPSIQRLLVSMGFEDILKIVVASEIALDAPMVPISQPSDDESAVQRRVLEAHKILMQMNQPNRVKFRELVETLQNKT